MVEDLQAEVNRLKAVNNAEVLSLQAENERLKQELARFSGTIDLPEPPGQPSHLPPAVAAAVAAINTKNLKPTVSTSSIAVNTSPLKVLFHHWLFIFFTPC